MCSAAISTNESELGEHFGEKGPDEEGHDSPSDQGEGDGLRELKEPEHLRM